MKVNLDKIKKLYLEIVVPFFFFKTNEEWLYKGEKSQVVSFYKYLGMLMTPKLIWSKLQKCCIKKTLAIFILKICLNILTVWSIEQVPTRFC